MRRPSPDPDTPPSGGPAPDPPPAGTVDDLFPAVYDELRLLAHRALGREHPDRSLTTTALVHEAYLRLAGSRDVAWDSRAHFFGVVGRAMRRVLVDMARTRRAAKRGGGSAPLTLDEALVADRSVGRMLDLDDALTRLAELDERLVRVVEYRYFAGLTEEETAEALGVTARTVRRDWLKAKGWLYRALGE